MTVDPGIVGPAATDSTPSIADVAAAAGVSVATVSNFYNRPERVAAATALRIREAIDSLNYIRAKDKPRPARRAPAEVGIAEVAAAAGVSVGTVSNYLNRPGVLAPATSTRVQAAIDTLGYVPNIAARNLRVGRSRSIGLLVLDIGNPFFTDFIKGAEHVARAAGYAVILGNTEEDATRESDYLDLFLEQRVAGVIVAPTGDVQRQLDELRTRGARAVLLDEVTAASEFCSLAVNDFAGGRMAVQHLLDAGRKRVAFVRGPARIRQVQARHDGVLAAIAGDEDAQLTVFDADAFSVEAGRHAGEQILALPPDERPTGVFAANDLLALGVLQAMFAAGVHVPNDVALMGYDDILYAASAAVPLTSIRQPSREMGAQAAAMLLAELESGDGHEHKHVLFEPEIIVRASTAPPSGE
ncbi:MAG TPA: LacI family DNA-binding transcriptional regulator [Agromyces sp.]